MTKVKKMIKVLLVIIFILSLALLSGCFPISNMSGSESENKTSLTSLAETRNSKKEASAKETSGSRLKNDNGGNNLSDDKESDNAVNNNLSDDNTNGNSSEDPIDSNTAISVILGRPAENSITLNVLSQSNAELSIIYGALQDKLDKEKSGILVKSGIPVEINLTDLEYDSQYYYNILYKPENTNKLQPVMEGKFHTARPANSSFTFAIEADPHLDEESDPQIYNQTLKNILTDDPDFLIDLGDIFMTDKLQEKSEENIRNRYLLLRDSFDSTGGSVPLFLTLGNHEGEAGWDFNNSANKLALFSRANRLLYFPNPYPDDFYSGNIQKDNDQHAEDYYSFNWGDALFIILDPYQYTENKPNENGWEWTLGKDQYDWLKEILEKSNSRYKFVFIHQLVGGDNQGRGGIEFASLYEWGGNNTDGSYGFDINRPGWGKSIHQLLTDNNVDVVFKGHDHFFAKQELDGVIYQTVQQPGHPGEKINTAQEYGYLNGEIIGGSGYLRVSVSASKTTIQFVGADTGKEIVYSYDIK